MTPQCISLLSFFNMLNLSSNDGIVCTMGMSSMKKEGAQADLDDITRRIREEGVTDELLQDEAQAMKLLKEWEL